MKNWDKRSREVAYLLNPAFCGRLIYTTIKTYNNKFNRSFPFPLVYLILPLVLHKPTRAVINSQTKLLAWTQKYQELLIDFPRRARDLVQISNESVEFLLQSGKLQVTLNGELEIVSNQRILSGNKFVDDEIKECLKKSEHIGRWFATTGKCETIYISLGVRP